jgi:mannose-1-phosphate guanylyltransferase
LLEERGPVKGEAGAEVVVAIMAGGAGTRFWPLSTEEKPKQFQRLLGNRSLLEESYLRARALAPAERIMVLTAETYLPLVREQLPELSAENVVGEPMRRDTAAAVALSALLCDTRFGDCVMVILTADHFIEPLDKFVGAVRSAVRAAAESETLYTFGVLPTYPAVCYGYLRRGTARTDEEGVEHCRVESFREKPDLETASGYFESGCYCWNSGMFVWRVSRILEEFATHLPGHLHLLRPAVEPSGLLNYQRLRQAFSALPAVSVDFGILEKAADVRMVAAPFAWSDVGGWEALAGFLEEDGSGNRYRGRLAALEARGNVVYVENPEEIVALVGIDDVIVVRAGGRTLVAARERADDIKRLVAQLRHAEQGEEGST